MPIYQMPDGSHADIPEDADPVLLKKLWDSYQPAQHRLAEGFTIWPYTWLGYRQNHGQSPERKIRDTACAG